MASRKKSPRVKKKSSQLSQKVRSVSYTHNQSILNTCVPITPPPNEEELPELEGLREQAEYQFQVNLADEKWHRERERMAKERLEDYAHTLEAHPHADLVYHYEGKNALV